MKLSNAFGILPDLRFAVLAAFFPTIKALVLNPFLLFQPIQISRVFMADVWVKSGNGLDEGIRDIKKGLIEVNVYGVVLDIGAGHGHTAHYLDPSRVTCYVALEPNQHMHSEIRSRANEAGFFESDGRLIILGCGAEDVITILKALDNPGHTAPGHEKRQGVDTLVSVLTLCSVPEPEKTILRLTRDVLKPGGQFLYFEHVRSAREDVVWWQKFWTPIWGLAFGGCKLGRPTDEWIKGLRREGIGGSAMDEVAGSMWAEGKEWDAFEGDHDPESLFCNSTGRFVKR